MAEEKTGKKCPQYTAACCICIGAMGTGTVLGWTANITDSLKSGELNGFEMDDDSVGWAGSSMTLGAMMMCFPIGWIADCIGRKPTVLMTVVPFVLGWLMIIFAQHVYMVYAGRFLTGIAAGSFCVIAPLYSSEIAETEIRGRLGTFFQLFITIGILYAQIFGFACPLMLYHFIMLAVPIVFGIVFVFQPESPIYLLKKGKSEKAMKAYTRLRGNEYDPSGEIKAINEQTAKEAERPGFAEAMKTKQAKKATLICLTLMFYQQLSGINAVIFYALAIFTAAGSTIPPAWCTILIGVTQVIATVFSSWSIEKVGRKVLLMVSCGLMCFACALLGCYFSLDNYEVLEKEALQDIGFLPVLSVIIFITGFSLGLGPIPWLAASEISPPEIMAKIGSAAGTLNWFLAFLVTRFYLNVAEAIGNDMTFYIFAIVCLTGIFFVLFVMPETKGKPFAQIQAELA